MNGGAEASQHLLEGLFETLRKALRGCWVFECVYNIAIFNSNEYIFSKKELSLDNLVMCRSSSTSKLHAI